MANSFVELQQAMKIQSEDLREALADLSKWEQEVNAKPKSKGSVAPDLPPVRGTAPLKKAEPAKPKVDPMQTAKEEGNEYFKRGDTEQAIRCYTKGIDLDPHNAAAHVLYANRAQCFIKLRKWEEAEKDATVSLQMNRGYSKAFFRRAVARKNLKKYKDARSDLETVLALQQGDADATSELKEVTQLLRAADAAAAAAAPAAASAGTARKKLVIKEVDDEDEDDSTPSVPARHVDPADSSSPGKVEAARKEKEEEARVEKARQERIDRDIAHLEEQQKVQAEQRRQQSLREEEQKQRQRRVNPRVEEVEDEEPAPSKPAATVTSAAPSEQKASSSQPRVPSVKVQAWTKDKLKTPKNFTEFERVFSDIRSDNELLDAYMSLIAPSSFKSIFGSSLTPEMLVDILEVAKRSTATRAKEILEGLASVNRLDELVMFFEAKEKAVVADVFALVANSGAPKATLDKLRSKFS